MTARTRIALLAVVASLGLVAVAYGAGSMVGGGSSAAAGSTPNGPMTQGPPARMLGAANRAATPGHHHPCPHHDGSGSGSSGTSGSGTAAPDAQAY